MMHVTFGDGRTVAVDGAVAAMVARLVAAQAQLARFDNYQMRFHVAGQRVKGPSVLLSLERDNVQSA